MKKRMLLALSMACHFVNAQPITEIPQLLLRDSLKLKKEVKVFGKGLLFNLNDRTATLQVLDNVQLKAMPVRSVNEALLFVPGLDLRQRGVQGIQGDLSIRGGTFEQNLILINGFKLVDPQTGHHALKLPVLLTNVESIEIYKGSGTRIFGQNAMTGAVNFVTQAKSKHGLNMQTYMGDFGSVGTQATYSAPLGKLRQSFSIGFDKSKGYWYNSDYTNYQYFYDAVLPIRKNQELKAIVGYADRAFGANGYYTSAFPDQWESTQMAIAGMSHQFNSRMFNLLTKVSIRTHGDEFRLKRFDPAFYTNKHWSEVLTIEETGRFKSRIGLTGFGVEYRAEDLTSSNLGERHRTYASGFLDHTLKLFKNRLLLVGNVHYFNLAMEGISHQKVLPGFEFSVNPSEDLKIFGNVGQSYRAPSYTELYYQDPANLGNPNLQPEFANNAELGLAYTWVSNHQNADHGNQVGENLKSKLTVEASVYRRNTTNMIDWTRSAVSNPNPWTPVNLSNVIFTGVESNISYRWNGNGRIMLRELSLGYNYMDANHQFVDYFMMTQSKYSFSGLRNQLIGKITLNITRWVHVSATYRGIDRVGGNTYSLVDAKMFINPSRNFSIFLEGNNLLNTEYIEAGYVQMPGRWFKAGVQVKFFE